MFNYRAFHIDLLPAAWHGYLPPIGVMIFAMGLGQVNNGAGWEDYFPWSLSPWFAQDQSLAAVSYVIVVLTSPAGMAGTLL